jgi:WD40 repeat protein
MRISSIAFLPAWIIAVMAGTASAQQSPSYARHVKPFLAKYCVECHNSDKFKAGLDLESFKGLREGADSGPVLVPGKPDESRLVLLVEGKDDPKMPPKKAKQPKPEELAVLRAWIAAGAKDDTATLRVAIPDIKPRVPATAPIACLAYGPDGKVLAAGGHKEVILLDVASGDVVARLAGQAAEVTALSFSRDSLRLAVASGVSAITGEIRIYSLTPSGLSAAQPVAVVPAHKDLILDLAFSPDGKSLATCGYDRLIKLWDVASGKELRVLKDHSDAVYGLAFSPDGRLLASAAADRAVKVWDLATGTRLYTLGEATDWLYAAAWSPDGRHLAAAGVDKSIRVWEVSAAGGKLIESVFAHEAPVVHLAYSADGQTLYSLSEDRTAKAWDTTRMVERKVYPRQPEAVLALAVRPDHKQLALGRYDGVVALLDEATGQVQAEPLPVKPKPPQLNKITPVSGRRGQTLRVVFEGKHLDTVTELVATQPGVTTTLVNEGRTPTTVPVDVVFPSNTPAGVYQLSLKSPLGATAALPFTVDLFPAVMEQEPNNSPSTGQKVALPVTLVGSIGQAGDVDCFRFDARAGQQIGVQALTAALGSKLDPVVQLTDATGQVLAESTNGVLGFFCEKAATYALVIRDREYRGAADMHYRLHVGEIPVVTAVFPLGLQRGTEAEVHLEGVHLGATRSVRVKATAEATPGMSLPVAVMTPLGAPLGIQSVVVGEFPEVAAAGKADVPVPGTANGRIDRPGSTGTWRFAAKKGQRLILEVNARRIGSPLDSYLEIFDDKGRLLPRATLRCLAKTYTTFRDHDSAGAGVRLEAWSELAVNDYIYIGSEVLRIRELPKNPDDDCQFFSVAGQRAGYLDTTPTYHSLGTPMYKVAIHPPGIVFPPNGLPVVTLFYRNDDGGPGYGKDSRLFFDPPADGKYQVRIGDSRGQGGSAYAYRLTIRQPRPSFHVSFSPTTPAVWKGGAVPVTVTADRMDGFDGAIDVRLDSVPAGFSAPATSIPAGEQSTAFALWADTMATTPSKVPPLKLVARASIEGREVVREVSGGLPSVVEPADLVTTTEQSEVTVPPGQQVHLTVHVERRNSFGGRVPVEVRGLPHGVRVLDIGLNGILITEKESSRTIVIYAEPWVQPMTHPFVVLARREGKNTEHAAKSVLLRVAGK